MLRAAPQAAPRLRCSQRSVAIRAAARPADAPADAYAALRGCTVLRAADGAPVSVTSLWGPDQTAVVCLLRSFG